MGKPSTKHGQVDVTYVKRGQLAAITRLRPEPSQRVLTVAVDAVDVVMVAADGVDVAKAPSA